MVFHRILIRPRTSLALVLAFAIVLFSQNILLQDNDFSFDNKRSVQLVFALSQDQINKLKGDLYMTFGSNQLLLGGPAPEVLIESTRCAVGSSFTIVDCTKLQSRGNVGDGILEFIVTIWPTQQDAIKAFSEAENSAKQNPVSPGEVNKFMTANGFKPSFFLADDRRGFTAVYTSPDEKPEIGPDGTEYTGGTIASGLVCGTVTAKVSHKTRLLYNPAGSSLSQDERKSLSDNYLQRKLTMSLSEVTRISGEIYQNLDTNKLCEVSQAIRKVPLIFIPGVAGTELQSGTNMVWPGAVTGSRGDLAFQQDGKTSLRNANIKIGDIFRSKPYDFYGDLMSFLVSKGYEENKDLFAFPYDWRKDNAEHIPVLDSLVNDVQAKTNQEKVILVAHSMGGLIAYIYAQEHPDKVDAIITVGTPWLGASKVHYGFLDGYKFGNPSVSESQMKILVQHWPAAYQLLPGVPFIEDFKTKQKIPLDKSLKSILYHGYMQGGSPCDYQKSVYGLCIDSEGHEWTFEPKLLENGAKFKDRIRSIVLPPGIELYTIIGLGYKTHAYEIMKDVLPTGKYLKFSDGEKTRSVTLEPEFYNGDGTVPIWSSQFGAADAFYYVVGTKENSAEHSNLPSNKKVQSLIEQILDGKAPPSQTPPPGLYTPAGANLIDLEPEEDLAIR